MCGPATRRSPQPDGRTSAVGDHRPPVADRRGRVVHLYIFYLASPDVAGPPGASRVRTAGRAAGGAHSPAAFNQGFYNLLLAVWVLLGNGACIASDLTTVGMTMVYVGSKLDRPAGVVLLARADRASRPPRSLRPGPPVLGSRALTSDWWSDDTARTRRGSSGWPGASRGGRVKSSGSSSCGKCRRPAARPGVRPGHVLPRALGAVRAGRSGRARRACAAPGSRSGVFIRRGEPEPVGPDDDLSAQRWYSSAQWAVFSAASQRGSALGGLIGQPGSADHSCRRPPTSRPVLEQVTLRRGGHLETEDVARARRWPASPTADARSRRGWAWLPARCRESISGCSAAVVQARKPPQPWPTTTASRLAEGADDAGDVGGQGRRGRSPRGG